MLMLEDIRTYVGSLGISEDDRTYIGKLDNKQEHSIGVYPRKGDGPPIIPLGGRENSSYDVKRISLLAHWDKDISESEAAACELYKKLEKISSLIMGDTHINFVILQVPEPVYVGTDDNGVHEYVIWLDFVYQRK